MTHEEKMMNRAEVLIEALPYIKEFSGKTFVIKYGGSVMEDENLKKKFIEDVALLVLVGINIVIVHGGGKRINETLSKMNITSRFVQGLRVTDKDCIDVVEMVLSGSVNKDLTGCLCRHGINAIGISGRDSALLTAQRMYAYEGDEKIDIGFVGEITDVNKDFLEDLILQEYVPIVSPVASDREGNIYNVNADYAAGAIAGALNAEKFILLSDIKGLYTDINDESTFVSKIDIPTVHHYIESGTIKGGMIPKMECCMHAIDRGTKQVVIIDGRVKHSLLLEIFTKRGSGTMVVGNCEMGCENA